MQKKMVSTPTLACFSPQASVQRLFRRGIAMFGVASVAVCVPICLGLAACGSAPSGELTSLTTESVAQLRAASAPLFRAASVDFDDLTSPGDIATGDLNGDGYADVVTTLHEGIQTRRLGLRLGDGRGGFGKVRFLEVPNASDATAESYPGAVAMADINGDGHADILAGNASGSVAAFLGDGRGRAVLFSNTVVPRLSDPSQLGIVGSPLLTGDFNEDGALDVLAWNAERVAFLAGDGRGGFTFVDNENFGEGLDAPSSFNTADLNADGHLDLAIVDRSGRFSVALGAGDGTFALGSPLELARPGLTLAIGDLNGDQQPDVAIGGYEGPTVLLNADGHFAATAPVNATEGWASWDVVIGDLTGDGRPDLATLTWGASARVLAGDGAGGFGAARDFLVGINAGRLVVTDLDGLGHLALVTSNGGASYWDADPRREFSPDNITQLGHGTLSVLSRFGRSGGLEAARNFVLGGRSDSNFFTAPAAGTADFDRDGSLDIVVPVDLGSSTTALSCVRGDGHGGFAPAKTLATIQRAVYAVRFGDFNNDGRTDIVTGNVDDQEGLTLLLADAQGALAAPRTITQELVGDPALIQDFDGDGKLDVGAFVGGIPASPGFNVIKQDRSKLRLFLGDGDGAFTASGPVDLTDATHGTTADSVAAADFNRDGRLDLVWAGSSAVEADPRLNTLTVLYGVGAGRFEPRPALVLDQELRISGAMGVADLNRDGWPDLVLTRSAWALPLYDLGSGGPTKVTVLLGSAHGFRAPHEFSTLGSDSLAIADFNGDQIPDIALLNGTRALIELRFGDGTGRFPTSQTFDAGQALEGFIVDADLNHDGRVDLVSVNQESVNASVFLNLPGVRY